MGMYIEGPAKGKAKMLLEQHGAVRLDGPADAWLALGEGHDVVCVVDNGPFEAAGVMTGPEELDAFSRPDDLRPKTWLRLPHGKARQLAGAPL